MRVRYWLAIGAMIAAGLSASSSYAQNDCRVNPYKVLTELRAPKSDLTMIVAHRGVHAVLGRSDYGNVPENSLESLSAAGTQCIEIIEVDVRLTQDKVAILSHDAKWGRETNVGAKWGNGQTYNPYINSGPNPDITSWSRASVQDGDSRLILRTFPSERTSMPPWGVPESPPTLGQAMQYMKKNGIGAVLAIDVKTKEGMDAVVREILSNSFTNQAFIKAPGSWFPHPSDMYNYLAQFGATAPANIKVMTVYNTADIAPGVFPAQAAGKCCEDNVFDSIWYYTQSPSPYWMGYEVNLKKNSGILQATQNMYQHLAGTRARSIFNPWREFVASDGRKMYFNSDASCCSELSRYFFDGRPYGIPAYDTEDNRPDWNFVVDQQSFTVITTDNVLSLRDYLNSRNRRAGIARIRD